MSNGIQKPEQSLQELAVSGSWKQHLSNGSVSEGFCIYGTGSWLPKAVTSQGRSVWSGDKCSVSRTSWSFDYLL